MQAQVFLHRYAQQNLLYPPAILEQFFSYTAQMISAAGKLTQFAFLSSLFLQTPKAIVSRAVWQEQVMQWDTMNTLEEEILRRKVQIMSSVSV